MQYKITLLCLLCCASLHFAWGQECTLTYAGQVYDYHDGEVVPFAKIQVKELNLSVTADEFGCFKMENICPGTYSFSCFHHVGCEPEKFVRTLQKDTVEKLFIEFHFEEFEAVSIVEKTYKMSPISVVKPTELERLQSSGKSLGDLLKNIPGVTSLNTGSTLVKPIVHGMHSNRVVLMNNGVRQEGQQWGSEHAPEVDPFLMEDVALVRGASAIRYGSDAIAGVILSAPKILHYHAGIRGQVDAGFYSNGLQTYLSGRLEGGFKKWKGFSYRLQGTKRQHGTLKTPDYYLKNTASNEFNYSGTLRYERKKWGIEVFYSRFKTNVGIFSAAHIGNLTDLYAAFSSSVPLETGTFTFGLQKPRQVIDHQLAKAELWYTINAKNQLNLRYSFQQNHREEFDRHTSYNDSLSQLNLPAFQLDLYTQSLDLNWTKTWFKKLQGEVGMQFQQQSNIYAGRFFIPNFEKKVAGLYWIETYKFKTAALEAGLRYDVQHQSVYLYENKLLKHYQHQFQNVSASLGFAKTFTHHWTMRINTSNAWRSPSINELYSNGIHHGAATFEVGDRNLKKELAYSAQAGVTYRSRKMVLQVDVYHSEILNYIYVKPSLTPVLTIKGAFPQFNYEQINARFSGIDLYYLYNFNQQWSATLKGALVRAFNRSSKSYLVGIPADRIEVGVGYKWKFKNDSELGLSIQFPMVMRQNRVEENSDFVAPPPAYFLVNAQIYYQFVVKNQPFNVSIDGANLTNVRYRDYLNRFRYYADELGTNIGIKLKMPFNYQKR